MTVLVMGGVCVCDVTDVDLYYITYIMITCYYIYYIINNDYIFARSLVTSRFLPSLVQRSDSQIQRIS